MATLKAEVQGKRKDGTYLVYIRVTHNRRNSYLKTPWVVMENGVVRGKKEICDTYVCQQTSKLIEHYYQLLNQTDTQNWTLQEVVEYLKSGTEDISFTDFARKYIQKMQNDGRMRTAKNYKCAVVHIHRFADTNSLMFSRMTSSFLKNWIESLSTTSRCKEKYPICVREIFKQAILHYNDEENGVVRIKYPWTKVTIPKSDTPEKRAIPIGLLRKFFQVIPDDSRFKHPLQELGQDVAKISICMCGINTIDLFEAKKEQLAKGIFWYNRAKTKGSRTDKAYFEIRIPPFLMPTIEKYLSKDKKSPWLFNFHDRLTNGDSFNANVNIGIDQICDKVEGLKTNFGAFRHTWATIAQNDCGASLSDVDFGLNHSTHKMARVYTKIDFSPAWKLNEKVMEFIFFSDEDSKAKKETEVEKKFEKLSKYNLIKGEVFHAGKIIAKVETTGFSNIDQVINALMKMIPSIYPERTKFQFKVTNQDKDQSQFYERCK